MIRIEVMPPVEQFADAFEALADDCRDWRAALEQVGALIGPAMAEAIGSEGRSIGETWPELAPEYAARKRGGAPLIATGHGLSTVFGAVVDAGSQFATIDLGDFALTVANFGRAHQPARPWFGLAPEVLDRGFELLEVDLDGKLDRFTRRVT